VAVTIGTVASGEQSAHDADKPLFLANNALDKRLATPKWVVATDHGDPAASFLGNWSSASKTLSTHPVARIYDRDFGLVTKPDTATPGPDWALLFDLDDAAGEVIDSIIIGGHNFNSLAGTLTVQFWVHNNADEPSGAGSGGGRTLIAQWSGAVAKTKKRLVSYKMGGFEGEPLFASLSTVRYCQVSIHSTSNIAPELGEVVIGRRRQLSRKASVGHPADGWSSSLSAWRSESGRRATVEHVSGLRVMRGWRFRPTGSDSFSLNDVDTIKKFLIDCRYGARHFGICPDPNTEDQRTYWSALDDVEQLELGIEGFAERSWTLSASEIAPSVEDENR